MSWLPDDSDLDDDESDDIPFSSSTGEEWKGVLSGDTSEDWRNGEPPPRDTSDDWKHVPRPRNHGDGEDEEC